MCRGQHRMIDYTPRSIMDVLPMPASLSTNQVAFGKFI